MKSRFVGIDVAKDTLMCWHDGQARQIRNEHCAIQEYLQSLPSDSVVGVEITSRYHLLVVDCANALGLTVYALNPVDCARYRQALHGRGKTDKIDAELIARFLEREHDSLRPYAPLPENVAKLRTLLARRETLVQSRTMLRLSLAGSELEAQAKALFKATDKLIEKVDKLIVKLSLKLPNANKIAAIPCVGALTCAEALSCLSVGNFKSADAFVAYTGYDCRPKDSGKRIGRRVLSKRGNRRLRKLLFLCAMSAPRSTAWKSYYAKQLAKGLKKIQAIVAVARKIARTIWSVFKHGTEFDKDRVSLQKKVKLA